MQLSQSPGQYALSYQGRYYPFNKPQIVIGSDPHCDIPIANNPRVLPRHAWLTLYGRNMFLQRHDSSAETWVNGVRVTQAQVQLQDRAEIVIGDPETKLTFLFNQMPTDQIGAATPQVSSHLGGMQAAMPAAASVTSTNTTRYLCAAGHLSEGFQEYVMRHIIYEDRRAMGESYGVDMQAVVSWCKSGVRRINVRDTVLLVLFLLICLSSLITLFLVTFAFFAFFFAFFAISNFFLLLIVMYLVERGIKYLWPRFHPGWISFPVLLSLSAATGPIGFFSFLALPLTIFIELVIRYYGGSVRKLSKGEFEKNLMPVRLDAGLVNKLRENFTTQQRNVVAYSGYAPFAGAGYYVGGWSFVVDTTKGAQSDPLQSERDEPLPFTLSQLYSAVKKALEGQGLNDVLEIEEKLYVGGKRLLENPPFFNVATLHPVSSVDQEWVEQFRERPSEDVRYYQCMRFNLWRGEVIFTAFLRFVRRGKNLFAEIDYLLLPPLKPEYYWVDYGQSVPVINKVWELVGRSFHSPLTLWFGVPRRLLRSFTYQREQQRLAQVARYNPSFDYGAFSSVRQAASDDKYHLFFQRLDRMMYLKIAEQELLEAIVQFLDEHHIDTSELRERQQTILNNSTIITAETIGTLQTGDKARATTNVNVTHPAETATGRTTGVAES